MAINSLLMSLNKKNQNQQKWQNLTKTFYQNSNLRSKNQIHTYTHPHTFMGMLTNRTICEGNRQQKLSLAVTFTMQWQPRSHGQTIINASYIWVYEQSHKGGNFTAENHSQNENQSKWTNPIKKTP